MDSFCSTISDFSDAASSDSANSSYAASSYYSPADHHSQKEREFEKIPGMTTIPTRSSRDFFIRRTDEYLERFRGGRNGGELVVVERDDAGTATTRMARLQSDMASLLESDVSLIQQLIALNESIEELKAAAAAGGGASRVIGSMTRPQSPSFFSRSRLQTAASAARVWDGAMTTLSMTGLSLDDHNDDIDDDDEDEEACPPLPSPPPPPPPQSAPQRKQYFSRQNSFLRVPIPPNRKRSAPSRYHHHRSSDILVQPSPPAYLNNSDWYNSRKKSAPIRRGDHHLSAESMILISPQTAEEESFSLHHSSQGSCDSGVHHLSSNADEDTDDAVFV